MSSNQPEQQETDALFQTLKLDDDEPAENEQAQKGPDEGPQTPKSKPAAGDLISGCQENYLPDASQENDYAAEKENIQQEKFNQGRCMASGMGRSQAALSNSNKKLPILNSGEMFKPV